MFLTIMVTCKNGLENVRHAYQQLFLAVTFFHTEKSQLLDGLPRNVAQPFTFPTG